MTTILSDWYSVIDFCRSTELPSQEVLRHPGRHAAYLTMLQNLVLCDQFLLTKIMPLERETSLLKNSLPEVVHFLDETDARTENEKNAITDFEAKLSATSKYYNEDCDPRHMEQAEQEKFDRLIPPDYLHQFLAGAKLYLTLATALNVYLSLHPSRSKHLMQTIDPHPQRIDFPVFEVVLRRFEERLAEEVKPSDGFSYVGVNLQIPAVAEHVLAFSKLKNANPLDAVREFRESKHVKAFRKRCSEIEHEMEEYGKRSTFRNMQKLLTDTDELSKVWAKDWDEGVRYKTRIIPLASLWGVGELFKSVGMEFVQVHDPVVYESRPAMLFLNDLYRPPVR